MLYQEYTSLLLKQIKKYQIIMNKYYKKNYFLHKNNKIFKILFYIL
jgi:hypothetical protein